MKRKYVATGKQKNSWWQERVAEIVKSWKSYTWLQAAYYLKKKKILYDTIKSCYDTDSHCCICSAVHMVNIASNAKTCYRRIALCVAYDFWHTFGSVVGKAVTPIGSDVIKRARWSFDFLRVCVL